MRRRPRTIGGTALTPLSYFTVTPDVTVNCPNTPAFSMTFPTGATLPTAANTYVAMYDPGNPPSAGTRSPGRGRSPATRSRGRRTAFPYTLVAGRTYSFVLFTNTTALAIATPSPTPSPTPTPTPLHLYVGNDNTPAPRSCSSTCR